MDLKDFVEEIVQYDEYEWWRTRKDISEKMEVEMTVDVFVNRRKADEFLRRGEWPQVKAYLQKQIHDDVHRQTRESFKRLPAQKVRRQPRKKKIVSSSASSAETASFANNDSGDSPSMDAERSSSSASGSSASAAASASLATSSASADGHPCCTSSIPAVGAASAAAEVAEAAASSTAQRPRDSTGPSNDVDFIGHPMITRARKRKLEDPSAAAAEDDDEDDTKICGICHEAMDDPDYGKTLKTLGCKHQFHSYCLRHWLVREDGQCFCPMCRTCVKCGIPKYRVNLVFFERRRTRSSFHRLKYLE